jgi:hypothetical protein
MTLSRRTIAQFEAEISANIAKRDDSVDTEVGPIKDLQVSPMAETLKSVHDNIVYLSLLQSMLYSDQVNPEDLDAIVFNESIVRWAEAPATTVVTFSRTAKPDADIVVPANFPVGTSVDPDTGVPIIFRTIESRTLYYASMSAYLNNSNNRYELDVPVVSVQGGTSALVGPGTITRILRNFPGFNYVTNKQSATSAKNIETNLELSNRYRMQIRGRQISTPMGLNLYCLDAFDNIEDAYVVYGNSPYLTRDEFDVGAVDVWLKSVLAVVDTYQVLYEGAGQVIVLPNQPLISVLSVTSQNGTVTYVQGTDYEVVQGVGEYSYSIRGSDGIRFFIGAVQPVIGQTVTIQYQYNSMMGLVSSYYAMPEHYAMGSDVLFRQARASAVVIEGTLKVKSGNPSTAANIVRNLILQYVNSLKLGESLEEFDLDAKVAQVYGIDNWTYSKLALRGQTGVSDISAGPFEYLTLLTSDLIINLSS